MTTTMKTQRGFSIFGLIFLFAILAVIISVAVKVFPPYMDFLTIADATKQTLEQPRMALQSNDTVMKKLANQLSINNIRLSDYEKDAILLSRDNGVMSADIDYTVDAPVFTSEEVNIELNMHFTRTVEARASE